MSREVVTVGYEGRSLPEFVSELEGHGVDCLVDVRLTPISRKKGFSKTALSEALRDAGIEYVHLRGLGNPKEIRSLYYEKRYDEAREVYRDHLLGHSADAVDELRVLAEDRHIAMMCFERDVCTCHRDVIAEELKRDGGFTLVHA